MSDAVKIAVGVAAVVAGELVPACRFLVPVGLVVIAVPAELPLRLWTSAARRLRVRS